jgi:hypothetical protein
VLKMLAFSTLGKASGMRKVKTSAIAQMPARTGPARAPSRRASSSRSRPRLLMIETVTSGEDGHLQQLDEPSGRPFQGGGALAEEEADEHAGAEANQDLVGERHATEEATV